MSDESEDTRTSERSTRRKSKRRRDGREYYKVDKLNEFADDSRENLAFREFQAMAFCHGLSEKGLHYVKMKTSFYLGIKAFLLYIQVASVLVVCLMAAAVFGRIDEKEAESAYYAAQLTIELVLLLLVFAVVLVESGVFRYTLVLAFTIAVCIDLALLAYFMLSDARVSACQQRTGFIGVLGCLIEGVTARNLSVYATFFLLLLHLAAVVGALMLNCFYPGTIDHLVNLAREVGFMSCLTFLEEQKKARRRRRRRRSDTAIHEQQPLIGLPATKRLFTSFVKREQEKNRPPEDVDIEKYPAGSQVFRETTTKYNFKGNVRSGGSVFGSGEEVCVNSLTIKPPNSEPIKREATYTASIYYIP
ncbi:hypothetical protein Q1695_014410 [Nippostrongylus brasiliensis]|nr:hypothetical protein Q1695_014410 [Nippostrongylus brasiliensis]